jgi:hypothetical protein
MSRKLTLSRRALVQGAAARAAHRHAGDLARAIRRDQDRPPDAAHRLPRPLGDFAVQGVQLAAEEINAAGGVPAARSSWCWKTP